MASDSNTPSIRLLLPGSAPAELRSLAARNEGYGMRIAKDGIRIWASTREGHFYGLVTLGQLINQFGHSIPCTTIGDAPALARRGVQLCFPQGHTCYRRNYMARLVPQLAQWKINELYLYLESYFDFPSLPHMAGPGAMTPSDARALEALCAKHNIKLIPMLNTLGHCGEILATQRYQHLSEFDADSQDGRLVRPFNLCANSMETHRLVEGMLNDLCDCFSADVIHIGGDEVSAIGKCPRCRAKGKLQDPLRLYLEYFNRVCRMLEKRGRKGGLWGDMLLKYGKSMPHSKLTKLMAPFVDRAVIYDWHYSGGSLESLRFFTEAGFTTIASSSTHLCYSSAMWPFQHRNQATLFLDAVNAGAAGGMTTAWTNWNGLHEEHFNYLHATGGSLLWSGPDATGFTRNQSFDAFEKAYCFQRYGMHSLLITKYLHMVGDAGGPILSVLAPLHGIELRKCLYHTDNVLLFWKHYARILSGSGLKTYKTGIAAARRLWNRISDNPAARRDPLLPLQAGPLLMHEHLAARYEITEAVYHCYDAAAKIQYDDPPAFRKLLDQAATRLTTHIGDFKPIEDYLALGRRTVGFDCSTGNRVRATKTGIRELAAFLRHLKKSHRPLPAFQQLADTFLDISRTRWYGDREHDWAAETPRFIRYTLNEHGTWGEHAATKDKEL